MDTTDTRHRPESANLPPKVSRLLAKLSQAPLQTKLAAIAALTESITEVDPVEERITCSGPHLGEASVQAHQIIQRLLGARLGWLAAEEADGRWATRTIRTFSQYVAATHHMSVTRARQEVQLAHTLRDYLPATTTALRAGVIGIDQAQIMASVAATSDARRAALAAPADPDDDPDAGGGVEDEVSDDTDHPDTGGADGADDAGGTGDSSGGVGPSAAAPVMTVEDLLLSHAVAGKPEDLRRVAKHFAALADPDADERGFHQAKEREYLDVDPTLNGYHVSGFLSAETGQAVREMLQAVVGVPAAGDTRSGGQRRAQALGDAARSFLTQGLAGTGQIVRPHLGVMIGFTQFQHILRTTTDDDDPTGTEHAAEDGDPPTGRRAGTGATVSVPAALIGWAALLAEPPARFIDGTGPVPPALIRRIACSGEIYRIIFGPDNEILNVGRKYRRFTGAQRRALIARDHHCTWPGCDAPPALCEAHHASTHWAHGGNTSTDNGALLCFYHHNHVDTHHITMTHHHGRWHFHRPPLCQAGVRHPAVVG